MKSEPESGDGATSATSVSMANSLGIRIIMDELLERGIAVDPLFRRAGLDPTASYGSDHMSPYAEQSSFYDLAAEALSDDFLGLRVARKSDPMVLGPISYVSLTSDTFGDALSNFRRYLSLLSNRDELEFRFEEGTVVVMGVPRPGAAQAGRQMADCAAAYVMRFCGHITDGRALPLEVGVPYPRPEGPDRHTGMFGCLVTFGHRTGLVRFRESDLALSLPTADSRLHRTLAEHCETLLAEVGDQAPQFLKDVRGAIARLMPEQKATASLVAADLDMSGRTFQRRLKAFETSFAVVRDEVKSAMAYRLLEESDESIAHVAYILNYASQSSFNSAFRRLTGKTPGEVRRAAQERRT